MDSVQRSAEGGAAGNKVPPIVHDVLRSPGQPLDPAARAFFEPRFGFDFSRVRIHADARAAESARAVHARAYTVGRNVVMGGERFSPLGPAGRRLLAHELAHAVQQGPASAAACEELTLGSPGDAHEREAERAAAAVFAGTRVRGLSRNASPALVARTPVEVRQATEAEQAEIVEMAARWLTALAERV